MTCIFRLVQSNNDDTHRSQKGKEVLRQYSTTVTNGIPFIVKEARQRVC